jgi:hypothetical protein
LLKVSLFEVFIIASLATYRLTTMIHNETGPGDIFGALRFRLGVRYDQYSNPYGTNWISEGILCFYCLSVWMGLLIGVILALAVYLKQTDLLALALIPFALSGLAVYLKKAVG